MDKNNENTAIGNLGAAFELALKQREFEISQLTQRNNFFMIFQGVLIAGLVQSSGNAAALVSFALALIGLAVSFMQIMMAGGAKYWQMRWERAAKTIELWLLTEMKDHDKVIQFFTSDPVHLRPEEVRAVQVINAAAKRNQDPLNLTPEIINTETRKDLGLDTKGNSTLERMKQIASSPIAELAIMSKPSVSRIPIYVGIALVFFWLTILLNTFAIDGIKPRSWLPDWITLTQLKPDPVPSSK